MADKLEDIVVNEDGLLLYNPYNNKNIEITQKDVESILKSYGLPGTVYNLKLYQYIHHLKNYN